VKAFIIGFSFSFIKCKIPIIFIAIPFLCGGVHKAAPSKLLDTNCLKASSLLGEDLRTPSVSIATFVSPYKRRFPIPGWSVLIF